MRPGADMEAVMRVMIVDDAVLLREGLARLLVDAGMDVVCQRGDAVGIEAAVAEHEPELVILDIRMPPTNTTEGLDAARVLRTQRPTVAVLLLSQHIETADALALIDDDRGAVGYLLKDRVVDIDGFIATLRRVVAGETVIDPQIVSRLVQRERRQNPLDALTAREREVLALMAEGQTNDLIASELNLNIRTVESHISSLFTKLNLLPETEGHRRVRAVLTYLQNAPS